jgi:hypothetical protein
MTRFEMLQRFAEDQRTEPQHIALFHAITESWNQQGRPKQFDADHDELSKLSRIKRTTYRKTLQELVCWNYIIYTPTNNRHVKSTLSFPSTVSDADKITHSIVSASDTVMVCSEVIMSGFDTVNACIVSNPDKVTCAIVSKCDTVKLPIVSESGTVTLFYRVRLRHSNPDSSEETAISDLSTAQHVVFTRNNNHLINSLIINSKDDNQVVNDEKGVQGKKRKRTKRESAQTPTTTFANSAIADVTRFRETFANDTTGKAADLDHYHGRLASWRDKRGNIPQRADWISTARTFMLNDYREGKLVTPQTKQSHVIGPHHNQARIEPPASRTFSW